MRAIFLVALVALGCNRTPAPDAGPKTATAPPTPAPSASSASGSAPAAATDAGGGDVVSTPSGDIRITPIHHATLRLDFAGKAVYVDPTKDAEYPKDAKAVAIFVTDIHKDHLDPATLDALSTPETVIIAPAAVAEQLKKAVGKVQVMKNGDVTIAKAMIVPQIPSLGVEAVPMYNLKRGPAPGKLYHDKGRGNGYVLGFGGKRLYISGDTECTPEMKALKDIDVAFVCMNLPYTMPPSEALECLRAFRPKVVYPYHFRSSDPAEIASGLGGQPIEVRVRKWY
jgi:L-ascorbate metabolism protein UlaG (beta-lactamase superfamily)